VLIGWFWKIDTVVNECELSGSGFKARGYFNICFKVVVPVIMAVVLVAQLMDFFG
jgi:SNF family Na+-dependent transporter